MESLALQRRPRVSAQERAQWISRYRSSQLSARQFAQQHGLNEGTFHRWVREEGQRGNSPNQTPGFEEVRLSTFGPAGAWVAEVVLPVGIVVRLGATAPPAWMRSLWESLRSSC
jgi:transposase-like protein